MASVDATSDARTVNNTMRHSYRVLSDAEKANMSSIKDKGLEFHDLIAGMGNSRELALAKTKIEEAVMWAVKHITAALLIGFLATAFMPIHAFAGDINSPPAFKAIPLPTPAPCVAGNCNGAYGTFGISNDADLGGILTNGSTNNGMGLNFGAGYQYWQGSVIAGFEVTGGYQFGTAGSTGTATSTQFVKLGYNFFPSSQTAAPTPGQSSFLGLVPANILANSTPAIIAGGCYGHGIEKGCVGLEVDSVLAASWSTAFQYYNAPSVKGMPDENVFRIMVQKHF